MAVVMVGLVPLWGPGKLELAALNVGQGDALLITTPHGERYLFDGGPSGIALARELGGALPHWERRLDGIFLTHPDQDHVAGLPEALRRFEIGVVYDNGDSSSTQAYRAFASRAGDHRVLRAGDRFEHDGVVFEVLWPPEGYTPSAANDASLVVKVTYGATSVLLTGDLQGTSERLLVESGADTGVTVLKVPHHGSANADAGFLQGTGARIAVVSVGAGNRYGHPTEKTLGYLSSMAVLRTDTWGRVVLRSDGREFRLVER
jgi:competence protein ComEC